ncbi:MAG: hypothetical protein BWX92_03355 [Deltaproteobacteria bacterium ADurb.Bin135]|nr:MAG: hypothetical protein BWX92_03355 [Deltaproteobacteria bacterium ADurb.Bin135]
MQRDQSATDVPDRLGRHEPGQVYDIDKEIVCLEPIIYGLFQHVSLDDGACVEPARSHDYCLGRHENHGVKDRRELHAHPGGHVDLLEGVCEDSYVPLVLCKRGFQSYITFCAVDPSQEISIFSDFYLRMKPLRFQDKDIESPVDKEMIDLGNTIVHLQPEIVNDHGVVGGHEIKVDEVSCFFFALDSRTEQAQLLLYPGLLVWRRCGQEMLEFRNLFILAVHFLENHDEPHSVNFGSARLPIVKIFCYDYPSDRRDGGSSHNSLQESPRSSGPRMVLILPPRM